jgi:hypothetical protein
VARAAESVKASFDEESADGEAAAAGGALPLVAEPWAAAVSSNGAHAEVRLQQGRLGVRATFSLMAKLSIDTV